MLTLIVGIIIGILGALAFRGARRLRAAALARHQHEAISATAVVDRAEDAIRKAIEGRDASPMSWASEQVLKAYKALPESSQIYGDITETLRALDTKHDKGLLNSHFYLPADEWGTARPNGGAYSWIGRSEGLAVDPVSGEDRRHQHHGCIGSEHYALHLAIADIRKALRDKEKAIELAGVQHELGQVPSLLEALKMEAEANRP